MLSLAGNLTYALPSGANHSGHVHKMDRIGSPQASILDPLLLMLHKSCSDQVQMLCSAADLRFWLTADNERPIALYSRTLRTVD